MYPCNQKKWSTKGLQKHSKWKKPVGEYHVLYDALYIKCPKQWLPNRKDEQMSDTLGLDRGVDAGKKSNCLWEEFLLGMMEMLSTWLGNDFTTLTVLKAAYLQWVNLDGMWIILEELKVKENHCSVIFWSCEKNDFWCWVQNRNHHLIIRKDKFQTFEVHQNVSSKGFGRFFSF